MGHKYKLSYQENKRNVLLIEDDIFASRDYTMAMQNYDFVVYEVNNPDEAISFVYTNRVYLDIIIIDIRMNPGNELDSFETRGGWSTGVALANLFKDIAPDAFLIALTMSNESIDEIQFDNIKNAKYCNKKDYPANKFALFLKNLIMKEYPKLQSFIVHGHDKESMHDLKNFLQNRLKWPEPIILSEKGSGGKTIIEKFEFYSKKIDIVFALFTPDDIVINQDDIKRARQNVIYEAGYFHGKLGRDKVFVLYKNGVELPSDLHGIIYIDISKGIDAASEQIRLEIESIWLVD